MEPNLWLYFLAVLAVILLPGMDMAYVMANSLSGGRRGAVSAVLGIASGGAIHVTAGATGIAALVVVFPHMYRGLLLLGTLYLLWIGWSILRNADAPASDDATQVLSGAAVYRRAVMTCLLNPKAYAFTLALFPAFIHSEVRSLFAQTLAMGLITVGTQVAVYGAVAAFAIRARTVMHTRQRVISRTMGSMLIISALLTAAHAWAAPPQADSQQISTTPTNLTPKRNQTMTTPTHSSNANSSTNPTPGNQSFDFLVGDWQVENHRLTKPLQDDAPWETFSATEHMQALPGGFANIDTLIAPTWRPNWTGMTLRIFNAQTQLWSLYWLSPATGGIDSATGALTPPVVGRFDEHGVGIFEGPDVIDGQALRVRYTWSDISAKSAKWQQAFSFDGGKTWKPNWYMTMTRAAQ